MILHALARRGSARAVGLVVAAIVGVFAIGIIAWSFSRHRSANRQVDATDDAQAPPDIKSGGGTTAGSMPAEIGKGKRLRIEMADRDDPSRLSALITAETFEQNESRRYTMHNPIAWSFQRDGRVARVSSRSGRAYIPATDKGSRPENAILEGLAEFMLFDPPPRGREIDLAIDRPVLIGKTEVIQYDGLLGEIRIPAPNRLDVTSDQIDFSGIGVTVLFNEPQERLESLHIEKAAPSGIVYRPSVQRRAKQSSSESNDTPPPAALPPTEPKTGENSWPPSDAEKTEHIPAVAFYHIVVDREVQVVQGGRRINADRLKVWVRLVDNKLVTAGAGDDAVSPDRQIHGSLGTKTGEVNISENQITLDSSASNAATVGSTDSQSISDNDAPIHITWTGPLDIRPLSTRPSELETDEIALLFSSDYGGRVVASDESSKARAEGTSLSYRATTRRVSLSGEGAYGATLTLAGIGTASAERFEFNFATGLAAVPGPGRLIAESGSSATDGGMPAVGSSDSSPLAADTQTTRGPRVLTWENSAEFQFATVDGNAISNLSEARLKGNVQGIEDAGSLSGEFIVATFEPYPQKPDRNLLSRLTIERNALAIDKSGGVLCGDWIETLFGPTPDGSGTEPVHVTAKGRALAARGDSTIRAEVIRAALIRNEGKDLSVSDASAHNSVYFSGKDGVEASCDELFVTPEAQVADLVGHRVQIGRGQTSIVGTTMRLEGVHQRLTVMSAGTFEHAESTDPDSAHAFASWTRQMVFDDKLGLVDCLGVVRVDWRPDTLSKDTLGGERIQVWLTPDAMNQSLSDFATSAGAQDTKPEAVMDQPKPDAIGESNPSGHVATDVRRILRARIEGGEAEDLSTTIARIESRRYAPPDSSDTVVAPGMSPDLKLRQLSYLEGMEIIADNERGTVTTPGPGKLLLVDRRSEHAMAPKNLAQPPEIVLSENSSRGNALFAWTGSMSMNRAEKMIRMNDSVRMDHLRADDGLRTSMECDQLIAILDGGMLEEQKSRAADSQTTEQTPGRPTDDVARIGRLSSTHASGRVWLKAGSRELRADQVRYDAELQTADAESAEGSSVTIFDQGTASPLTARSILWNLRTGRIEIKEPGTLVAPR